MSAQTDEQKVRERWPDAEITWGRYGARVVVPILPKPKHWWNIKYRCLNENDIFTLASEAWADAARRIAEKGAGSDSDPHNRSGYGGSGRGRFH